MQILLAMFYFFYFAVAGVFVIFFPKLLLDNGYSAIDIGIIFSVGPMVRFLIPFVLSKFVKLNADTFKISLFLLLLGSLCIYNSIDNFYYLISSVAILSIGFGIILPYVEVISLELFGKQKYGKVRLFGSIGFMFSALVLVELLFIDNIVLYSFVLFTLVTFVVGFIIISIKNKNKNKKINLIKNDIKLFLHWELWIGLTLVQVSFGSFYGFFTIYETDVGISMQTTVYLWIFGVFTEILMLYFQGKILVKNLIFIIKITIFISAIRWFLLFMFPQNIPILYFSQGLHAFSFALFHSATISYLYVLYKNKQLAQQYFSGITYGLGGLSGSLLAGYIFTNFKSSLFLSSSLLALLAFYFIYRWERKTKL